MKQTSGPRVRPGRAGRPSPQPITIISRQRAPRAGAATLAQRWRTERAESIRRDQGRILDGRNRNAACDLAGVEPWYETYKGDDPDGQCVTYGGPPPAPYRGGRGRAWPADPPTR